MEGSERMSEYPTSQELLDRITASGYDGYWSMTSSSRAVGMCVTVYLGPKTDEQLEAALGIASLDITADRYTVDGHEFACLHPWTICFPTTEAQS